ncbi:MAG: Ig-like domain-containing protein, partial [Pirellulales bacterium]
MRKTTSCLIALVLSYLLLGSTQSHAVPPKVIQAVPDNGDIDVAPNLNEIRITFDQPMSEGMSVVGGGETYPEVQGRPQW